MGGFVMSTLEDRLDFYVGAYFKINPMDLCEMENEKTSNYVIRKCIDKAYQDLKRRISYRYSNNAIANMDNEEEKTAYCKLKKEFYENITSIISNYLKAFPLSVIDIENINPYGIIEEVIKCSRSSKYQKLFRDGSVFSVGLAQKWVNMTLKYLWILGVLDDKYEEKLDVPIDSYILEEIAKIGIEVKDIKWSTWNSWQEYKELQNKLKEMVWNEYQYSGIRWENEKWVEAAVKNA